MTETIGQREDGKAFEEMLRRDWIDAEKLTSVERGWLRYAYDAGMKRREEKRGCCEGNEKLCPHISAGISLAPQDCSFCLAEAAE